MDEKRLKLKKLPIGKQSIKFILENDYLYVDKTKYIYDLITSAGVYFLSRPRRFGKSLLVSTFNEIFKGNKELFKDQWIYKSDYNWKEYPVIRVDMSGLVTESKYLLEESISITLKNIADIYNVKLETGHIKLQFAELIQKLAEKSEEKQVVILIDEYDKAIVDNISNKKLAEEIRDTLRNFYTIIKSSDEYVRFVFLTGVSKFSKMSVFSGLNNLEDLTMNPQFSAITGITQQELEEYFSSYIDLLTLSSNLPKEQILANIKIWYNGYRFSTDETKVYNPFSTLLLFKIKEFANYWVETGTPTFLIDTLNQEDRNLEKMVSRYSSDAVFGSYEIDSLDPKALLLQTGYLTISNYIKKDMEIKYKLDFPNREVRLTFNRSLLANYSNYDQDTIVTSLEKIKEFLRDKDFKSVFTILSSFFAKIPSYIIEEKENYYHTVFFTIFELLGMSIEAEVITNKGRVDAVVEDDTAIYIFEFKLFGTAEEAMKQIKKIEYFQRYQGKSKDIYLFGVEFNKANRNIGEWKKEEILKENA